MDVCISISTVEQCLLLLSHLDHGPIYGRKFGIYVRRLRLKMPLEQHIAGHRHTMTLLTKLTAFRLEGLAFWRDRSDPHYFDVRLLKDMIPILRRMDALVDFTVCNYLFYRELEFPELLSTFPHLRSLHLSDLMFSCLPLCHRLSAPTTAEHTGSRPRKLSALTELTIYTSLRSTWSGLSPLLNQQQIRLSTLYVRIGSEHGMSVAPAQQSFFTSAIVSRLEQLSLSLPVDRRRRKLPNCTECDPGSLNHIRLTATAGLMNDTRTLDLSRMGQLRVIKLKALRNSFQLAIRTLESIRSPQLEKVLLTSRDFRRSYDVCNFFEDICDAWGDCDEFLARLAEAPSHNPPRITLLIALLLEDSFGSNSSFSDSDIERIFANFSHLRAGGHYVGLRFYSRSNPEILHGEFWCNDHSPPDLTPGRDGSR